MDASTNFLINLILFALALVPIGLILWGIALLFRQESLPASTGTVQSLKPGWVSAEAQIIDKQQSGDSYSVTYRFTDNGSQSSQIYTRTQPVTADQYAALLKGAVTQVMYPPNRPSSAELMEQRPISTSSSGFLPTFGSVINGIALPFIIILNLVTMGAFMQSGGPAPTSRLKLPIESETNIERGWSYIIGGGVIGIIFIVLFAAITSGQPAAAVR